MIVLGVMQLAKKIPFEDPNVLNACRAAYAISNLLIIGIYLYVKSVIDGKKGTSSPQSCSPTAPANPFCLQT